MTKHDAYVIFWSLFAAAASGALFGLVMMDNPAINSLDLWMSDIQTCIESYGSLTCGLHHIVGSRLVALFAVGALIGVFCALPTILRCLVQHRVGFTSSVMVSFCMGVIVYGGVKFFGLVGGFLFADLFALGFMSVFASMCSWQVLMRFDQHRAR
jgi:hypothetical protein